MKKRVIVILLTIIIIAGLIFGYFGWEVWKKSQEVAFMSCLASIMRALNDLEEGSTNFKETENWIILEEKESEDLLKKIQFYDCKGLTATNLVDPWGNKVFIAYKHNTSGTVFLVWTSGKDKVSGNDDDLVYPFRTKTIPR